MIFPDYKVIIVIVILILFYHYYNRIEAFVTSYYVQSLPTKGFDGHYDETAKFINFNLTQKPRFNNAPYTTYQWWKKDFNPSINRQYHNCDQYRCQTHKQNGVTAKPHFNLQNNAYVDPTKNLLAVDQCGFDPINLQYIDNPQVYCAKNPHFGCCPNNWIQSQ